MKRFLILLMFISLSACDVKVNDDTEEKKLTYSYTVNNCATGEHTFSSLTDMCRALANDNLNNYCASEIRCQRFKDDCKGLDLGITCDL